MSSLTTVQQTEFDALVKVEYRSRGFLLRDTVRVRTDVIGATCQFRKMGQIIANATGFQNTITIQDPGFTAFSANLVKYTAGTGVDEIQDLTVNFDTRRELSVAVAMAIGRRSDQIIINSLGAGGSAQPDIAAAGANMTYGKLRTANFYFDDLSVPIGDRFVAMSANNLRALLADDHFVSRFYSSNEALPTGTLNYKDILGMNVRIIPQMDEGGLPIAADIRSCYAWHKIAMGMAIGQDMRTEVNYLPRETTWFVNGIFYAGSVTVDNRGVYNIKCDETVNP